ncbi:MAG: polysaccharide pyruvyl transferase family protein [Clostridia bacterium]|nr:polysaccharide pyruvyl transferase family protein [Clostridia bacterium]
MKVCVLSMQRVKNYGSLLQAYSLKKLIESLGHEVSFIDIAPNNQDNSLRENVVEYDEGQAKTSKNIISRILVQDKNLYFAVKKALNKKLVQKKQIEFGTNYLKLDYLNNDKDYDVCVIGSDEVFNCMNNAPWGFTTQLFGNVENVSKIITYAASCGFTTCDMLSDKVKNAIKGAFKNVSSFSVRDENTKIFVEELGGETPQINLDPVVVGDFEEEISKINIKRKLPSKYCIIYAYHDRINSPSEIKAITDFCNRKGLTPVTIGGYQKWVRNHLALSPFEVLLAFKQAEFVITDTFHGTIFSAKYAKKFGVIVRDSNRNKLSDLIKRLGIENQEIINIEDIESLYEINANRKNIDKIIELERKNTLAYLEKSL